MKNVLVPTDFSAESHHAFGVALRIAERAGGSLTLLHVVEMPEGASFITSGGTAQAGGDGMGRLFAIKLLEVTKQRMAKLIAQAHQKAPGVVVHDVVLDDRIGPAILKSIETHYIDLVVVGAQGHTAMDRLLMGSNTERLVRLAPCPVLAVKHAAPDFNPETIVFPSDFTAEADRAAPLLQQVQKLFPDARLRLLHVTPDHTAPNAAVRMETYAKRHGLRNTVVDLFVDANELTGIDEFVQNSAADLVILPTHGRTGLSRYLNPSVAERVAVSVLPPVLTVKI